MTAVKAAAKALMGHSICRCLEQTLQTKEGNITTFKKKHKKYLMERGYLQNSISNTILEVKFQERTLALLQRNKTKKTNPALSNTMIPPCRSKSSRNPNEEVVPNKAPTTAKPNFQGAGHNIIRKGAFAQKHTRKRKTTTKTRKLIQEFRSCVGL